jgi:hypothetical protein
MTDRPDRTIAVGIFSKSTLIFPWLVLAAMSASSVSLAEQPASCFQIRPTINHGLVGHFSDCETQFLQATPCAKANDTLSHAINDQTGAGLFDKGTLLTFLGVDGSKQPQDFGANAHLGLGAAVEYSGPLFESAGIGFQIGNRSTFHGNAVQVFELLGESKDRFQNFTTVGLFQRLGNGFSFGATYDFLTQESFDNFSLGQWRLRASLDLNETTDIGITLNLSDRGDTGRFNNQQVRLEPIEQLHVYLRRRWQTGVESSFWIGVADEHSEENAVTGTLPPKTNQVLFGSEIHVPLNHVLAIYGETNLVMPADTGAVDAYLGFQFAPQGVVRSRSRGNRFRALLPVASNPGFTTDLTRIP